MFSNFFRLLPRSGRTKLKVAGAIAAAIAGLTAVWGDIVQIICKLLCQNP